MVLGDDLPAGISAGESNAAFSEAGVTHFVTVKSLVGSPCFVQTDIPNPNIYINGKAARREQVQLGENEMYEVAINEGDHVTFTPVALNQADLTIASIPVNEADRNLFGLNEKTTRLPGHKHYYRK